jgi:5'-3' exonuclease
LEYTRYDFELLELKVLRQMFKIQFRKLADKDSFDEKYDPNRIIDDFVFMVCIIRIFLSFFPFSLPTHYVQFFLNFFLLTVYVGR